jgi:flagellar assembly protein FliH
MARRVIKDPKIDPRPYVLRIEVEEGNPVPFSPPQQHSQEEDHSAIMEEAKRAAEEVLKRAKEEAENIRKEGYGKGYEEGFRSGYEDGYKKGREDGEKELEELRGRMRTFLERLESYKAELALDLEQKVLRIALDVARKVVKEEIRQRPELVLVSVKEAVSRSLGPSTIRILVSPEDVERVEGFKEEIKRISEEIEEVEIIPDERIEPGGCVVETPMGKVDARIDKQFERIEEMLEE